ncbi:high mobility group protein B1-like [Empidonax traillii]|uniref:high mobility group protein B1-like n=1 Tax=Empidonax traillii TaxID=164674 RepID=UPI000FFD3AF5|nr:high mobility group protein B1-like [Empidonax traillii]
MARPPGRRGGKALSTQLLFRISIQRAGPGGQPLPIAQAGRKGRAWGRPMRGRKSVRFSSRARPLPAFFLFMAQHRKSLQASYPNSTVVQMAKRMGRMWHKLPRREQERYMNQAERMKRGRGMYRSRAMARRPMGRKQAGKKNLVVCFTTKAASLRNFLMSYL